MEFFIPLGAAAGVAACCGLPLLAGLFLVATGRKKGKEAEAAGGECCEGLLRRLIRHGKADRSEEAVRATGLPRGRSR